MNEPGKLYGKYSNQISNKNAGRLPIQMLFDAGTSINRSIQILGVVPSKNRGYAGIGNEIRESPPKTVDFTKRSSN
jgi:hypothetical protein